MAEPITVEVVYALKDRQDLVSFRLPAGATVLSPACIEIAQGPDGSTVCSIPPIPVVSLLIGREQVNVSLSGY